MSARHFDAYGPALDRPHTGNEYMAVLQARLTDWEAQHSPPPDGRLRLRFPPLLEWFIRDEDEALVVLPDETPAPRPKPQPRYYRPASYWREQRDRLVAEMERVAEPILPEVAAARGQALGHRRTARVQQREDAKLSRYCALRKRLDHADAMLRAAERRESR